MTIYVILFTFVETTPMIVSTLTLDKTGMMKFGFLLRVYCPCVGDWLLTLIVYGPMPCGALLPVTILNGDLLFGVIAKFVMASANRTRESGLVRFSVMVPALSLIFMPAIL